MTSTVFITFAAPPRVRRSIVLFEVGDWIHRGVVKGEPWPVAAWIARVVVPRLADCHHICVLRLLMPGEQFPGSLQALLCGFLPRNSEFVSFPHLATVIRHIFLFFRL